MQVIPGSSWSVVEEAKDLNPFRVRLFRYNAGSQLIGIEVLIRTLHPRSRPWGKLSGAHVTRSHPRSVASGGAGLVRLRVLPWS
ncbi:hypothetical protein GCM10023349_01330 [Nocardioides conyzicola]|uniref:Uncharacterized protein n=1 Tax=Nocardioides conyzicola TaxID=1651781 RepID=A0ABP8WJM4_9ACTN